MNWDHEFCISDAFGILIILASNVLIIGLVLAGLSTAELYNCWQLATFLQWRFNFCILLLVIRKQLCSNRLESLQGWIIQVVKIQNKSCLSAGELIYVASLLLPAPLTQLLVGLEEYWEIFHTTREQWQSDSHQPSPINTNITF